MENSRAAKSDDASPSNDTVNQSQIKEQGSVTGRRKVIDRREERDGQKVEQDRRKQPDRRASTSKDAKALEEQPEPRKGRDEVGEDEAHKLASMRRLLATCERVNTASYHNLALEGYPSNYELVQAQRLRDGFIVVGSLLLGVFIVGAGGLINAWISAIGAGLSALSFILAFTPLQSIITNKPSIAELRARQNRLVMNALSHVRYLEGVEGLAWRCAPLGEYNAHLYSNQFSKLIELSKKGALPNIMRSKKHFRLYLMFMLEAQKAYQRLQKDYLNNHFANMEGKPPRSTTSA